jgi:hypothetical protein
MARSTTLAIMAIANDEFNAGRTSLALDVARAVTECRVALRVESSLRAMDESQARQLFLDLEADLGSGPPTRLVYEWLDRRFPNP